MIGERLVIVNIKVKHRWADVRTKSQIHKLFFGNNILLTHDMRAYLRSQI